jgi:hypothetical protein
VDTSVLVNETVHTISSSLFTVCLMDAAKLTKSSYLHFKFQNLFYTSTTDSQMFRLLLINLWVAAFTVTTQTGHSLHVRTVRYQVQNYSSAKCEEEFTELVLPVKVPRPNSTERNSC